MKRILAVAGMLAMSSIAAFALDTCTGTDVTAGSINLSGNIQNNVSFGPFAGNDQCNIGGEVFSNFQIIGKTGFVNPTAFTLSISINGSDQIELATTNLGAADIEFFFQIAPGISSITLSGSDNYSEIICATPFSGTTCSTGGLTSPALLIHTGGGPSQTFAVSSVGVHGVDYVFKDLSGSSDLEQGLGSVPEPATYSMMGLGLLGLGAFARRRKS